MVDSDLKLFSTFLEHSPLLETLDIQLRPCEAVEVLARAIAVAPNLVEIHVRLIEGEDDVSEELLLDDLAQRASSGCVNLEMMAVWFEWADASTLRVPDPWVLHASDCACVAIFHVVNVLRNQRKYALPSCV